MRFFFLLIMLSFNSLSAFASECDPERLLKSIIMSSDYTPSDRLAVLTALRGKQPANLLSPLVIQELEKIAHLSSGSIAAGKFDAEKMIDFLSEHLSPSEAGGEQIQWLMNLREKSKIDYADDQNDLIRGFGFLLLPKNDEIFSTPTYLNQYLGLRKQGGHSHWGAHTDGAGIDASRSFKAAWETHFPKLPPKHPEYHGIELADDVFFQTGSDANNALYEIANYAAARRLGMKKVKNAEILFFEGSYGAGRGRMRENSFFKNEQSKNPQYIPGPYTTTWNPTKKEEVAELLKKENLALETIRKKAARKGDPIGGILLEAIPGAYGVVYYRPQFLKKLRALCDELKIPIFADEILNGGGRTGKFFSYQHYKGFQPDFVTYGKGLHVAGLARVHRRDSFTGRFPYISDMIGTYNTLAGNGEALLKGAVILDKIRDQHLIENADKMGKYFVRELRKLGYKNARGKGLLINPNGKYGAETSIGSRYMPYMTITKEQIDKILLEFRVRRR